MRSWSSRSGRLPAAFAVMVALASAPASAGSTPLLAGATTVSGTRSASMLVRIPRAVDIGDVYADFRLHAPRGRIAAVLLKKTGPWDAPFAQTIHHGFCVERGCASPLPNAGGAYVWAPGSTNGLSGRLPAGTYRLYLVADGARVTATLRLRGLAGSTRLTPRGPIRASFVAPKPTVAEPASGPSLFAGGSTHTTPSTGGINDTRLWKVLPTAVSHSAVGACVYDGKPPKGGTVPPYQMPCPDGSGGFPPFVTSQPTPIAPAATPVGPGRYVAGSNVGYLLPPGMHSIGEYSNTAGPVTAAYVHQLWLDF